MSRHVTVLVSPSGEEFFDAYGPMTKNREEATVFTTNEKTLSSPSRFGGGVHRPFWDCEIEADIEAQREFRGWTFRHEHLAEGAL